MCKREFAPPKLTPATLDWNVAEAFLTHDKDYWKAAHAVKALARFLAAFEKAGGAPLKWGPEKLYAAGARNGEKAELAEEW